MFTELKSTVCQHKVELDKVTSQTATQDETMAPMKATLASLKICLHHRVYETFAYAIAYAISYASLRQAYADRRPSHRMLV